MKSVGIFLALLAAASAIPTRTGRDLPSAIAEITAIINLDGFIALITEQTASDPDMQRLAATLSGAQFVAMVTEVQGNADFQAFIQFNSDKGVDLYALLQPVLDLFGWPGAPKTVKAMTSRTYADLIATWAAFFEGVGTPALSWLAENIEQDQDVYDLMAYIQGQSFQDLVQFIRVQAPTQSLVADLEADGLDINGTFDLVADFLGWDLPPY